MLPRIQPTFVAVTGDITDAKSKHGFTSGQNLAEWKWYAEQLHTRQLDRSDYWFDLRGNHDCFSVADHEHDLFGKYSVQKSSSYAHRFNDLSLSIMAFDGCPASGLPRPYNFFGSVSKEQMNQLERQLEQEKDADFRILLGHYPTVTLQSSRSSSDNSFALLTSNCDAYLTGHLHRLLFGLGKTIKAVQPNGLWDLEVADLKDHGAYRIGVVDQGRLSFHEAHLDETIIICGSSPPDSRLELCSSDEIRVFVFTSAEVGSIIAEIDDLRITLKQDLKLQNLYTGRVPDEFSSSPSTNFITFTVLSKSGDILKQADPYPFSRKVRSDFGSFGEALLRFNLARAIKLAFSLLYAIGFALAIFFFVLTAYKLDKNPRWLQINRETLQTPSHPLISFARHAMHNCFVLGNDHVSCRIIFIFMAYLTCGPWILGPLADGSKFTCIFLFGVWQKSLGWSIFLDTWFYALIHIVQFILPGFIILAVFSTDTINHIQLSDKDDTGSDGGDNDDEISNEFIFPWYHTKLAYAVVLLWYSFNMAKISLLLMNYGPIAWLFSPVYTWYPVWFGVRTLQLIRQSREQFHQVERKSQ